MYVTAVLLMFDDQQMQYLDFHFLLNVSKN